MLPVDNARVERLQYRAHTSMRDRGNPPFFHKFPPKILNPARQSRTIFFIIIIHNFAQRIPKINIPNWEEKSPIIRRR